MEATKPRNVILAIQAKFFRRLRAESRHAPGQPDLCALAMGVRGALDRSGASCLLQQILHEPPTAIQPV
ncbi:MAG: hypothetical protein DME58_09290 [Verrucomicrobia bacterium]|nr:MAG: hypothetical protein DME58_09290 [Verrucomicrobiota bacterium]